MKRQGKKAIIFLVIWCLVLNLMPSLVFAEEAPDADAAAASAAEEAAEPEDEKLQEPEQKKAEKDPAPKDDQKTEPAEGQEEGPTAESEAAAEKPAQTEEAPHLMNAPLLKAAPSISFQSYAQAGCRQFWSTGGEGFVGTCCQPGVSPDDSGTATMSKFDNASLTAKLAYQYGCKNNWIRSYTVLDGFQDLTNAARFMYMIQMSQVGINQWNGWAIDNNFSQRVRTNAIDMYNSAVSAVANLSVPEGFECYLCYPASGHQRFILYKYVEPVKTGFAKVVKKAGVPGDLASLSGYTLAGAKYQVYTNADCTTRASAADRSNALFTTSSSGESQLLELHVGDYWLKEAANPRGYAMDQTKTAFTVTAGAVSEKAVAVNVKDRPVYGTPNFRVYKTDTTGTFQWDKIGKAAFTVKYYDVANKADIAGAKPERTWTFTTSEKAAPESAPAGTKWSGFDWKTDRAENGSDKFYEDDSGNRVIPLGWFTIEEVTPPRGFMLTDEVFYGHVYLNSSGAVATDLEKADSDGRLNMKIFIFRDKQYKTTVHKTNASGAELANIINEAALRAIRGGRKVVTQS
ncbi:MAG: hypothetical protein IJJ22_06670, partial [Oscillospiraceae bacterium]|nr:hypothetical protein [Oscillospiraceae bacterium]